MMRMMNNKYCSQLLEIVLNSIKKSFNFEQILLVKWKILRHFLTSITNHHHHNDHRLISSNRKIIFKSIFSFIESIVWLECSQHFFLSFPISLYICFYRIEKSERERGKKEFIRTELKKFHSSHIQQQQQQQ